MTIRVLLILLAWTLAAVAAGASGVWLRSPAPLVGAMVWLALGILLVAWRRSSGFARWLRDVDPRSLILLHLTRFVGFAFFALAASGKLSSRFAWSAGLGDILAALGAAIVAIGCIPARTVLRRRLLLLWNGFGTLDLVVVVASALHSFVVEPAAMKPLRELPLCLLPTLLVPVLLFTHVVVFFRFGSRRAAEPDSRQSSD